MGTRRTILLLYIELKALFQVGAWPQLYRSEAQWIHTALMRAYRRLLPPQRDRANLKWWSDAEILDATGASATCFRVRSLAHRLDSLIYNVAELAGGSC